jgi:NADH:ubiquinone oxidoreductase subunit 6 (subunit J)
VGQELVTALLLPFEVVSLVFVAAIVGAIAMASSHARR